MATMITVDDSRSRPFRDEWSPTSLNLFIKCPLAYWFEKAQGWKQVPTEALSTGILVHSVLEDLLGLPADERTRDSARELFATHWEATVAEAIPDLDLGAVRTNAGDAMGRYFALEDPATVTPADDGLERTVSGALGGIPIGGKIDRVEPGDSGMRIVDYKTGSAKPPYCGPYWRQQLIYAALLNSDDDSAPASEVSLMFLGEVSRVMTRPVPGSAIARVTDDLAVAQEQRAAFDQSAQWEARESGLCRFCPVARVCPAQAARAPIPGSLACDERLTSSPKVRRVGGFPVEREDDESEVGA